MSDAANEGLRSEAVAQRSAPAVICDHTLAFVTPQLQQTLEVWRAKRAARTLPARSDFTIKDLKFTLPNLAFLSIVREGARVRFKVRLMGSELDTNVLPATGQLVDEAVPTKFAEKWASLWLPTIASRAPSRHVGRQEFRERRCFIFETFSAPLADDGETPDILMIASYYHLLDETEAQASAIAARLVRELRE